MPFARLEAVEHEIHAHYRALRAIRTRKALERSALWASIGAEVRRVLEGVERADRAPARPAGPAPRGRALRAVAWNVQRGARLDELRRAVVAPPFADADVLLLSEVDVGLGRSGNRNVARELAEALDMSYAFGVSYLALTDDFGDDARGLENTLALSGAAVLSRHPIGGVENIDLPEIRDKFHSSEKRLGKKRALRAEVALPDGPLVVAACHLDSNASPAQRCSWAPSSTASSAAAWRGRWSAAISTPPPTISRARWRWRATSCTSCWSPASARRSNST